MLGVPRFPAERIADVARNAIGCDVVATEHLAVGLGNENWRVTSDRGETFLVKVADAGSSAKWSATAVAYDHATEAGVPAPRLVHLDRSCPALDGAVVRILTWIDGHGPNVVLTDQGATDRFFAELGTAVARLHGRRQPAFSSRLDGSKPRFDRWDHYVDHRLPQVLDRARSSGRFEDGFLQEVATEIGDLAALVAPEVEPALCHRDLHLGNLLARSDGSLAAILDFDIAEPWDPAVDLVKLRWLVFPMFAGAAAAFDRAYFERAERPARWAERLRLVDLLELVNTLANADEFTDPAYEARARDRLGAVLGQ